MRKPIIQCTILQAVRRLLFLRHLGAKWDLGDLNLLPSGLSNKIISTDFLIHMQLSAFWLNSVQVQDHYYRTTASQAQRCRREPPEKAVQVSYLNNYWVCLEASADFSNNNQHTHQKNQNRHFLSSRSQRWGRVNDIGANKHSKQALWLIDWWMDHSSLSFFFHSSLSSWTFTKMDAELSKHYLNPAMQADRDNNGSHGISHGRVRKEKGQAKGPYIQGVREEESHSLVSGSLLCKNSRVPERSRSGCVYRVAVT